MRVRHSVYLVLPALLALPGAAPAQQAAAPPTLVLRIRSLDTLLESGKLLANAAGQGDLLEQLKTLVGAKVGPKEVAGAVDAKRPLGLYARVGKEITDLQAVLLVPVANEKQFLTLLDNLNFKAEQGNDGLYTVKQTLLPLDVYLRFAHDYAYLTALNPDALRKTALIPPGQLFPAQQSAALSLSLRLDQVPDVAKQVLLQHVHEALNKAIELKEKGESKACHQCQTQLLREVGRQLTAVVRDGVELNAEVDVEKKTRAIRAQVMLTAKPGSALASTFAKLGKAKTPVGGVLSADAALNVLVRYTLPEKLHKALRGAIDEAAKKALAGTTDEARRQQAARLLEALAPTFQSGEVDFALSLRGPSKAKRYTVVAGLRVEEGEKLHQTLRDLLKEIPEGERDRVKLDVEKIAGAAIHALDLGKEFDARGRALFGDGPLYVAFRPDAVLVGLGEDGLKALKAALQAPPTATAPLRFDISPGRLAALGAKTRDQARAVEQLRARGEDGRVHITVEGGATLRVRFRMGLSVVRLLSDFATLSGKAAPPEGDKE